jgi:hypothetical protein
MSQQKETARLKSDLSYGYQKPLGCARPATQGNQFEINELVMPARRESFPEQGYKANKGAEPGTLWRFGDPECLPIGRKGPAAIRKLVMFVNARLAL